jgi:DNA-binding SARP family transcriptional activator
MARAAAKRRPPVRRHDTGRKHKDSGGQRYEDTLFFNRLRTHAKWVFVLLIIAFTFGFVLFGVGSSNLGGLGDIFNGIRGGGSGNPSVDKALKATEKNPKDAVAWKNLASAYDSDGDFTSAIPAWEKYTKLRPKDVDGLNALGQDYLQKASEQQATAQAAQLASQNASPANYGPPTTSPLGRALGSLTDPLSTAAQTTASTDYSQAYSALQATTKNVVDVYGRLAKLQPTEPSIQLQLAQAAESSGNVQVALTAYQNFIKIAPDDPSAPQAKQRIKILKAQAASTTTVTPVTP